MQLAKPKSTVRRVYVTAKDAETGQSKSTTLYETTPAAVIASIEETAEKANPSVGGHEREETSSHIGG